MLTRMGVMPPPHLTLPKNQVFLENRVKLPRLLRRRPAIPMHLQELALEIFK